MFLFSVSLSCQSRAGMGNFNSSVWVSSVQFSRLVVSDSLRPHELQHARPPCPSPTAGVYPNSCPSSPWCHPAISSSVVPFSSCPQSLPASESFLVSQVSPVLRPPHAKSRLTGRSHLSASLCFFLVTKFYDNHLIKISRSYILF